LVDLPKKDPESRPQAVVAFKINSDRFHQRLPPISPLRHNSPSL
jgi:hypothetical protein